MSDLFGGGETTSTVVNQASSVPITYRKPRAFGIRIGGTPVASIRPDKGVVSIGRNVDLRNAAKRTRTSIAGQRSRIGGTINQLKSNMNPFIQARVRPLEQALGERVADQSRGFARRGIFGSLSENEINKTRFLGEREIGDARALATDEAIGQLFNAEATLRGVNQDEMAVAETLMRDELARLGISLEALNISLGDQLQMNQVAGGTSTQTDKAPSDILGGIGKIIGIASAFGG